MRYTHLGAVTAVMGACACMTLACGSKAASGLELCGGMALKRSEHVLFAGTMSLVLVMQGA